MEFLRIHVFVSRCTQAFSCLVRGNRHTERERKSEPRIRWPVVLNWHNAKIKWIFCSIQISKIVSSDLTRRILVWMWTFKMPLINLKQFRFSNTYTYITIYSFCLASCLSSSSIRILLSIRYPSILPSNHLASCVFVSDKKFVWHKSIAFISWITNKKAQQPHQPSHHH